MNADEEGRDGLRWPKGREAARCYGIMESSNPYEAPSVDPTLPLEIAGGEELATLGERFVGSFVDGLVSGLGVLLIFVALWFSGVAERFTAIGEAGTTALYTVAAFAVFVAINWRFLKESGQTIGKKAAKTKVVTLDGRVPRVDDQVFKRYAFLNLIGLIPVVGTVVAVVNILFIFGKERRCLHDRLAGTKVVKARS